MAEGAWNKKGSRKSVEKKKKIKWCRKGTHRSSGEKALLEQGGGRELSLGRLIHRFPTAQALESLLERWPCTARAVRSIL